MTDVLTVTNPLQGAAVTAQGTPDMTVAVAAGYVISANSQAPIVAGNVTITAADVLTDRVDAIVADSTGALSAIAGPINDGLNAQPPDIPAGYTLLAHVYVYSRQHRAYTGTITSSVITDKRTFTSASQPADTMAYTMLSGAQSAVDPGTNNFGFDNVSTWSSLAHIYVNYRSSSWPYLSSTYKTLKAFFQPFGDPATTTAYYLMLWSRKSPNRIGIVQVTSFTDHTTWADLGVTPVTFTTNDAGGAIGFPQFSTDAGDTIFQLLGAVAPAPPTTWTFVRKTATTSRNTTTTLTADPDLQFTLAASTTYEIRGVIRWDTASVTPGFKYDWDGPASPTRLMVITSDCGEGGLRTPNAVETTYNNAHNLASTASSTDAGTVAIDAIIENGSTSGTFSFRWAQLTSNGTNVNVRPGSYLEYRTV